jgi:hypothetical protein
MMLKIRQHYLFASGSTTKAGVQAMEASSFAFFDACQGVTPIRVPGEWTDYLKGQCAVMIVGLPVAAVVFLTAGLI